MNVTEDQMYAELGRLYLANRLLERALQAATEGSNDEPS